MIQNSGVALGTQSQQLRVVSSQKVNKNPSSYMSEDNSPTPMLLEIKKAKFYAQIEQIKDTRLIENLGSLKSKQEKQECINSFSEIYNAMIKNILEIGETVKQIRFNDTTYQKASAPTIIQSQASREGNTISNNNVNNLKVISSLNPNMNLNGNSQPTNDPKNNIEIQELPDQIIKDCKSIHNIFADIAQDSSLKHLDMCCEIFELDGSSINLKFKISQWYNDIKEQVEKNRPLNLQGKNTKKTGSGKGLGSILCPCFGSSSKPSTTNTSTTNPPLARNSTTQAVQNMGTNVANAN